MGFLPPRSLQHLVTRCLGELRGWLAAHPRLPRHPNDVYARVERSLRQLRRVREPAEAERALQELELLIRDEGPLTDDFVPSLETLRETVLNPPPEVHRAPP